MTNEWFKSWRAKYSIPDLTVTEGNAPVDDFVVSQMTMSLVNAVNNESLLPCQMFKCDKTVLSYKSLPNRKMANDDVTIMTCSNADGSFKLPLVVAVGSKSTTLPEFYSHQSNFCIDSNVLNEWFNEEFIPRVTEFLKARNLPLKAKLIAESVPDDTFQKGPTSELQIHLILHNFNSIFGLKNNESLQSLKINYEYKLLTSIINAGEALDDYLKKIEFNYFFSWIGDSWTEVKPSTIVNCWKKILGDNDENNHVFVDDQEINAAVLLETLKKIDEYHDISIDDFYKWLLSEDSN